MIRPQTNHIVLCSSETSPTEDIGLTELDSRDRQRGWFKCLYHFVIRRNGTIEHGLRKYTEPAMGLRSLNGFSVSICIVGGKGEPPIEQAQIHSCRALIDELLAEFPDATVIDQPALQPKQPVPLAHYFVTKEPTNEDQPEGTAS